MKNALNNHYLLMLLPGFLLAAACTQAPDNKEKETAQLPSLR